MVFVQQDFDFFSGEKKFTPEVDTSTFVDNMKRPVHRWFRYSAGFSAEWVKQVIIKSMIQRGQTVFDPFAGSGTTLLAAQECGFQGIGVESHPFVFRIAQAKLLWHESPKLFLEHSENILNLAREQKGDICGYSKLMYDCFPEDTLRDLDALKKAWIQTNSNSPSSLLTWLALTKILRECSPVGTSQMELIQPKKRKQNVSKPFSAFAAQVNKMCNDMISLQNKKLPITANIYQNDARSCSLIPDNSVNLVITSPPYINNFDYADSTRLEITFWGEITSWADLHEKIRQYLIRSCAQHMSYQKHTLDDLLNSEKLKPIIDDLHLVCRGLAEERLKHGGKKNYHLMTAAYFLNMAEVWIALRRICCQPSRVCFVIGDSAPYGVYVPVHEWLGKLSLAAGFKSYQF